MEHFLLLSCSLELCLKKVIQNYEKFLAVLSSLSNISYEEFNDSQNVERCFPMQKNISLKLTNEQVYRYAYDLYSFLFLDANI